MVRVHRGHTHGLYRANNSKKTKLWAQSTGKALPRRSIMVSPQEATLYSSALGTPKRCSWTLRPDHKTRTRMLTGIMGLKRHPIGIVTGKVGSKSISPWNIRMLTLTSNPEWIQIPSIKVEASRRQRGVKRRTQACDTRCRFTTHRKTWRYSTLRSRPMLRRGPIRSRTTTSRL